MLTVQDLFEIKGRAAKLFANHPPRCRLEGMSRDLNDDEIRLLSIYEASLTQAYSKLGFPPDSAELKELFNTTYQRTQEPIEGEDMSFNLKAQG